MCEEMTTHVSDNIIQEDNTIVTNFYETNYFSKTVFIYGDVFMYEDLFIYKEQMISKYVTRRQVMTIHFSQTSR